MSIFKGTSGDDFLSGGSGNDIFRLWQGGDDTANGGDGNDLFKFGAAFTAADKIDGGTGNDTVSLKGDYSAGVIFNADTMVNVETIKMIGNFSYNLTTDDATVAAGQTLTINARGLGTGHTLTFDGSNESDGSFTVLDSRGNDLITGGDQRDHLNISAGGNDTVHGGGGNDLIYAGTKFTAADHIDGGSGFDTLLLDGMGAASSITFAAATLTGVERLSLLGGHSYNLTTNNANVAAGDFLEVDASRLGAGDTLTFNGSHETNGYFVIIGGAGDDVITGGQNGDVIDLSHGGNDTVTLGDTHFGIPNEVNMGAALTAADHIDGSAGLDFVFLNGDYTGANALVFNATTMIDVDGLELTSGHSYDITTNDANLSDTGAMQIDGSLLGVGDSLKFDGSAETGGTFFLIDGLGNDVLKGGGGADFLSFDAGGTDTGVGGGGDDFIDACGHFDSTDQFDGGTGTDTIELTAGDAGPSGYTGANALVITASMMSNIEVMQLDGGGGYDITTVDANIAAGSNLTVDASGLDSGDSLTFNGSAETDGSFAFQVDASTYSLVGGAQDDTFYVAGGFSNSDTIDGGGSTTATGNAIEFDGDYSLVFSATAFQNIQTLLLDGGHSYAFTLDDANVASGASLTVDGSTLGAGDTLTFDASAESNGTINFYDGAGDDALTGGQGTNTFNMAGGGTDTVTTAFSFTGQNYIFMGANLTAADTITGNVGYDEVHLDGDYTGANAVVFTATTMTGIDDLVLAGGHSYDLTTNDATVDSLTNPSMTVDSTALGAGDTLKFDGSAELDSNFIFNAGQETDTLTGGAFADTFNMGAGLTAADKIDGGGGFDTLNLDGDYSAGLTISDTYVNNIEDLTFAAGHSYKITISGDITDPTTLTIDGSALGASDSLTLDLTAATSSGYTITGGAGDDTITGPSSVGMTVDLTQGGVDTVHGGDGNDTINFGTTLWSDDQVDGGAGTDTVHVSGFSGGDSIVFGANTLTNVEDLVIDAGGNGLGITTDDNTVAAGQTLEVDASAAVVFAFDGSGELDGHFNIIGGSGDDDLTGGTQSDTFDLTGSGTDTVHAGGGNDTIDFGASLTGSDTADGGTGNDTLILSGNAYSDYLFSATNLVSIETLKLTGNGTFGLSTIDANVAAGATLTVDASLLTGQLNFNGSSESDGHFAFIAGSGNETLTGGGLSDSFDLTNAGTVSVNGNGGDDTIDGGAVFKAADIINGGAGNDTLTLDGNYSPGPTFTPITFNATTINSIEQITLLGSSNFYSLVMNDGNVASGETLTVDASAAGQLTFDGSAELDGHFHILSTLNGQADQVGGGQAADTIDVQSGSVGFYRGNGGNDTFNIAAVTMANNNISGDAGDDVINVTGAISHNIQLNGGADNDTLNLNGNFNSNVTILGGTGTDTLNLTGDYSSDTILGDTKISSVENLTLGDGFSYVLTVTGDLTSAGGLLTIDGSAITGASDAITLDLASATSGSYVVTGGAGDDTVVFNLAAVTGGSTFNGGSGNDTLELSSGDDIVFGASTITSVETLKLDDGSSYFLTTDDANVAAGATLTVDASALTGANVLSLNGSAETDGFFDVTGGAGNDTITLSSAAVVSGSTIDGGAGNDTLVLGPGTYTVGNVTSVENLTIGSDSNDTSVTWTSTVVGTLTVDDTAATSAAFTFDGSGNTGAFHITTGGGNQTLTGGDGNDTFDAVNASGLALAGNGGDDTFNVGVYWHDAAGYFIRGGSGNNTATFTGDYQNDFRSLDGKLILNEYDSGTNKGVDNIQNVVVDSPNPFSAEFHGDIAGGQTLTVTNTGAQVGLSFLDTTTSVIHVQGNSGGFNALFADNFNVNDQLDGGSSGLSTLYLEADYSGANALVFNDDTIVHIHNINVFAADITTANGNIAAGEKMFITASSDPVTFNAAAETDGFIGFIGGAGDDTVTLGHGAVLAGSTIDGGDGNDKLILNGDFSTTVSFGTTTVQNVETIQLIDGDSYSLALSGDTVATGATLTVDGSALTGSNTVHLDFDTGGGGDSTYIYKGGAGDDVFSMKDAFTASDQLDGGTGFDEVALDGDYSAGITFNNSTITNIDFLALTGGHSYKFTTADGNIASGQTLSVSGGGLLATDTLTLDGSAETNGFFDVFGGAGNDTLKLSSATVLAGSDFNGQGGTDTLELNGDFSGGVTLGALALANVETIKFDAGHTYNLTSNDGNVASTATLTLDASALGAANGLTFDGSAETNGHFAFIGGAGNDTLTGGALADSFDLTAGGTDTAHGGGGDDTFNLGAALNSADTIDGGSGNDTLTLSGNAYGDYIFGANNLLSIETLTLTGSSAYGLSTVDNNVAAGATLVVDGTALTAQLSFNGAAETDGSFNLEGGSSNDTLVGGAGNDAFNLTVGGNDSATGGAGNDTFSFGAAFTAADIVNGGANSDTISLNGDYSAGVTMIAATMTGVENIVVAAGHSYKLTTVDANIASGATLTVTGSALGTGDSLTFDGSAETDGHFAFIGGAGTDTLTGGSQSDTFDLTVNDGTTSDVAHGGGGNDSFTLNVSAAFFDTIDGGAGSDTITLAGNVGTFCVLDATRISSIETLDIAGTGTVAVTINGDIAGGGQTLHIAVTASDSLTEVDLSAATSTLYTFTGSTTENDTVLFGANFNVNDQIDGGGGVFPDDLTLEGDYSGAHALVFNNSTITDVGLITVNDGFSYDITLADGSMGTQNLEVDGSLLTAGHTLYVNDTAESTGGPGRGALDFHGGAGDDVVHSGVSNVTLHGNGGNDTLDASADTGDAQLEGGAGQDTITVNPGGSSEFFIYDQASDSSSTNYDIVTGMNFNDAQFWISQFDPTKVTAIDSAVTSGTLDTGANFDTDLAAAMAGHLGSHHALLFTVTSSSTGLSGHNFLVVDINGTAGYQAGQDIVIDIGTTFTGTLSASEFV